MLNKMSKEELEMLSYTKIAEMYLKENSKAMNTAALFREVCKLLELGDSEYQERIADFFESLTTSKEFILLNDGNWDLKSNHSVKIDMEDIYDESDSEMGEEELNEEESIEEDDYSDNYNEELDDDIIEDDYADLSIVDEEELEQES